MDNAVATDLLKGPRDIYSFRAAVNREMGKRVVPMYRAILSLVLLPAATNIWSSHTD